MFTPLISMKCTEPIMLYKELYGELLVPQNFIVPQGEEHGLSQELWWLQLGEEVSISLEVLQ
jgi:hypothetical protein